MYKKKILKNRLAVVSSPMRHMESISIGIWIGMGGRYEDKKSCGISHFIEHMLFKGTLRRNASQLKQEIEGVGGHFNGFTSEEVICYLVKMPAQYLLLGLDVLSDMVLNPKMDELEIEREKKVICEEIKMYEDRPSSFVHEILAGLMWPEHPLGRPLTGHINTVRAIDRKVLLAYKEKFYQPANMAVIATGKMYIHKLLEEINRKFRTGYKNSKNRKYQFKKFKIGQKRPRLKLHFKDTEQAHIAIGFHAFGREDKDKYALNLLNIILGGNMSSRLFEELRERQALCYDISSSIKKYEETGAFLIHAGVDNSKAEIALRVVMRELTNLKKYYVSKDELRRAKEFYKGQFLLALEDTGSRMLWLGDKTMTKEGIPGVRFILKHIERVNIEDIRRVANRVFKENFMNLAAIGRASGLRENKIRSLMEL